MASTPRESTCDGSCVRSLQDELASTKRALETAHVELEQADRLRMLGTLTASIAHEVNNILTPALNYVEIAEADPQHRAHVDRALASCGTALRRAGLVSDAILKLAKGEPRFHVEPPAHDGCIVADAFDQAMLCMARDPEHLGVELHRAIDPRCTAAMTPIAMEQVLLNLLLNAIAATERGGSIRVEARTVCKSHGRDRTVISVSDTGCGMEDTHLRRIFEPFVSLDEDPHRTGLGLMICHRMIADAGGTISVQSTVGEGTTFTVDVPEARLAWRESA